MVVVASLVADDAHHGRGALGDAGQTGAAAHAGEVVANAKAGAQEKGKR